jgi:hypothetical protein
MWYRDLPEGKSWAALWAGYVRCGTCSGIRTLESPCPGCQDPPPCSEPSKVRLADERELQVSPAFMGAEGRYEDWVYLSMLQAEWTRPLTDNDKFLNIAEDKRPAARSVIVLIFWSYFETRIDRLFRESLSTIPDPIVTDLLRRYSSVGSRLDRLYRTVFSTTYWNDLNQMGYHTVCNLLQRVHQCRNEFMHGKPEAIDDKLISDLIAGLKDEHEAWISVFNKRATRQPSR